MKIIFTSSGDEDQASWLRDVLITWPQNSLPPLVVSANNFSEIRSKSCVNGLTCRMYPSNAGRPSFPYSYKAILMFGREPLLVFAAASSLTIFHNCDLA